MSVLRVRQRGRDLDESIDLKSADILSPTSSDSNLDSNFSSLLEALSRNKGVLLLAGVAIIFLTTFQQSTLDFSQFGPVRFDTVVTQKDVHLNNEESSISNTNAQNDSNIHSDSEESLIKETTSETKAEGDESIQALCPEDAVVLRLLFPHVNKAGGRSLESTFDEPYVSESDQFRFITRLPRSTRFSFELIDGHHYYDWVNMHKRPQRLETSSQKTSLSGNKVCSRWIYFARDPMTRTLSAFYTMTGRLADTSKYPKDVNNVGHHSYHFFCRPGSLASGYMTNPEFNFEDFAHLPKKERDECMPYNANLHVKYLTGKYVHPDNKDASRNLLNLAKERLRKMAWFGILEHFQESMQLFSYVFGADLVRYTPVSNANAYNKTISDRAKLVLTEFNGLDMELYKFAYELFQNRIRIMKQDRLNRHYNAAKFECAKRIQCWDKHAESLSWDRRCMPTEEITTPKLNPNPSELCTRTSDGLRASIALNLIPTEERKGRVLCAPIDGCYRKLSSEIDESSIRRIANNRCLLNFLILGTRKGGTSSLYHYISKHPLVRGVRLNQGAQTGELFFFRGRKNQTFMRTNSGKSIRTAYNNLFQSELSTDENDESTQKFDPTFHITGESSVDSGPSCVAPDALRRACGPGIKLIFLVRNPIERLISQHKMRERLTNFQHSKSKSLEDQLEVDIAAFLKEEPKPMPRQWWNKRFMGNNKAIPCLFTDDYLNGIWSGLYIVHLSRWMQHFHRRNILVLKSEDFFTDPANTVKHALEFISLDPGQVNINSIVKEVFNSNTAMEVAKSNESATKYEGHINPNIRARLRAIFKPYNEALTDTFGIDTADWA